ncbi:hypothetical protein QYF61_022645 [Mycteria americana]|uniref:Endonuclease/exonuclease/phosphatase domain-containing protein n=1 Tax=Mycteria americana TaxID=33587 RepID=A0AAN7NY90_MYCAM|nr:hypothetical protein QYF61_022645 [Mycteria americana]
MPLPQRRLMHWCGHTWSTVSSSGLPSTRDTLTYWRESSKKGHKDDKGPELLSDEETLSEGACKEDKARLFSAVLSDRTGGSGHKLKHRRFPLSIGKHFFDCEAIGGIVLLGDFNHPDICWKSSTVSYRQSRRLLECIRANFLRQVIDSPTRGDVIMDLMVTNASELICDVRIGGSLGCSDHALMEFAVLSDMGQAKSIVRILNFRKAKFQLFKELINRTSWEMVLRDRGAEQIFKDAFHRVQELLIPRCKKLGKDGKRLAWMS